ncbi:MAG: hypothetical protein JHC95_07725 [Solirubrobacteraceae bacterium]|nr:hypothetical protein [Solirubrobacteraceae bacterium]
MSVNGLVAKPIAATSKCSALGEPATVSQAGKRTDFCVALKLDGGGTAVPGTGDDMKDLTIGLPPGVLASPNAATLCTEHRFESTGGCSSASQVGTVSLAIDALGIPLDENLLQGQVYNLQPVGTEPARLGLAIGVKIGPLGIDGVMHLVTEARLRADDSGLNSVTVDAPRDFFGIPIEVHRMNLALWGSKTDHPSLKSSFMSNATTCTPAVTKVQLKAYSGQITNAQTSFTPTGCDQLVSKAASLFETSRKADTPGFVTVGVTQPDDGLEPLAAPHLKKATVVMPEGIELSPTVGSQPGFVGCSAAQVGLKKEAPATCPARSQIGTVSFKSPLLLQGAITGKVFVANPEPGEPKVRFYIVAEASPAADALRIKLLTRVYADPATGQLTAVLDDLPAAPFTEFRFSFNDGPNGPASMPRSCGTYEASTKTEPMSGGAPKTTTAKTVIDQDCNDPDPFTPTFGASVTSPLAGGPTGVITTINRPSGDARMKAMDIELPTGLSGKLTAATLCPLSLASAGNCGEDSKVGHVNALAGSGPDPVGLRGDVYLTEGPDGALAGLAINVDVKVGPLDFGKVITQAKILVRPDTGLTLSVPNIPQRQEGVEANIRQLEVVLDKQGFNLNATSCQPNAFRGTITADTGAVAKVEAPYQPTGCDSIPFGPKVEASITGGPKETGVNGHPSLNVAVTQTPGEANSSKMEIVMPEGIAADVTRLKSVCSPEQWAARSCPPESVKGTAKAWSPLLPTTLEGPVTFVTVPGQPLPGLKIQLRGALNIDLSGTVKFGDKNRLVTQVDPIPDTPLSRFELTLASGPNSPLIANKDLCQVDKAMVDGTAWSHAGTQATLKAEATIPGCEPAGTLKLGSLKSGSPTMDLRVSGSRAPMTVTQLTLPKGLTFAKSATVKKRLKLTASGLKKGTRATVRITKSTIRVTVPKGQNASVLRVRLSKGGLKATTSLRKKGRPRLTFRLSTTTADKKAVRASLRVRPATR